jgi:hypothetical protein
MHGKCVFTYADGAKCDGEYKDDKMHGKGVFVCASGRCMVRACLPVLVADAW